MNRHHASAREMKVLRTQVIERDGYTCQLCGQPIAPGDWEPDHIVPRSKGGSDVLENLRSAHKSCNRSRINGEQHSPVLYSRRMGIENMTKDLLSKTGRRVLTDLTGSYVLWRHPYVGREVYRVFIDGKPENMYGVNKIVVHDLLSKNYIAPFTPGSAYFTITEAGRQALERDKAAQAFRAACKGA